MTYALILLASGTFSTLAGFTSKELCEAAGKAAVDLTVRCSVTAPSLILAPCYEIGPIVKYRCVQHTGPDKRDLSKCERVGEQYHCPNFPTVELRELKTK